MFKKYALVFIGSFFFQFNGFAQLNFVDRATELGIGVSCGDVPIGNGITFYDYNNDGWDDITLATQAGEPIRFFKNMNGVFIEETLNIPTNTSQMKQVNWVDFDNDGHLDVFVTSNASGNKLYRNDGNYNFLDVTIQSQLPTDNIKTYGASWGDYNKDGFLDVFLSNRDLAGVIPNYLYKNNGDGTFSNVSETAGILNTSNLSFCSAFFDFNNDGLQDIYVSKDRDSNKNVLYKNNGDGTFSDVSESSNTDLYIDAMSVTIDDYNSDGWLDIYVTNTPSGNIFLQNNGDETFTNVAVANGTDFGSIAWGAVFLDAENDMDLDLYVSGLLDGSNANFLSAAFYENDGFGNFTISTTGFVNDNRESYSNAIGDIDNDGFSDIVVSNADNDNIFVWKNETQSTNNWLKINLVGTQSNKKGVGSLIEISVNGVKQYRYTLCGEGYLGQNSSSEIFGLGDHDNVDYIKVNWLSGIEDVHFNVSVNQTLNLVEGEKLSSESYISSKPKIYPNPVLDVVTIENSKPMREIKLTNTLGQVVFSKLFVNHVTSTEIDISNLHIGQYILIVSSTESKHQQKLIKN
ncbi:FG-GAP-like repeat-containing protein [Psychroserpens ponticola]|uniref:FG-GAP-like repeat-containing protein n=1 Tax=Psychroserpens ponticola TaxID=2932268 RepID=A0ABY7RTR1_9FLAO|nr:FG-GAP-like repeat-containing protein [Psychroserpens ponticola]WCO00509.1 FG-GAP-like repeat-containing protein [Psychroserpens ponticola]